MIPGDRRYPVDVKNISKNYKKKKYKELSLSEKKYR